MEAFRTIEVKRSIFDNNDRQAEQLRRELKEKRVFLLNLMSSRVQARRQPAAGP